MMGIEDMKQNNNNNHDEQAMAELPKYKSHKVVHALKIKSIEYDIDLANKENRDTDGSAMITPEDKGFAPIRVDHDFVSRIKMADNDEDYGYYVVYEDGYKSWSPTKAFEEGYTRI